MYSLICIMFGQTAWRILTALWGKASAREEEGNTQNARAAHLSPATSRASPASPPPLLLWLPRTSPAPHAAAATQLGVEAKTGEERGEEHRPEDLALGCPRPLPGPQADLALGRPRPLPGLQAEGPGASHSGRRTWTGRTCACSGRRSSRPGRTTSA